MPTRSKVVVVIGSSAKKSAWARRLESPSLRVREVGTVPAVLDCPTTPDAASDGSAADARGPAARHDDDAPDVSDTRGDAGDDVDAVLIDAAAVGPDLPQAVRSCRRRWPDPATPVLVVNLPDAAAAAAVIDAGATDGLADAAGPGLVLAHVLRVMRAGDAMRDRLDRECQRLHHESLTRAAAEVARPLGEIVDEIESVLSHVPAETPLFDELLDRVGRAVDALDRLRGDGRKTADDPH